MFRELMGKGLEAVSLALAQGAVDPQTGEVTANAQCLTTAPIAGGNYFVIHLNPQYRIARCHWYDRATGELAQYNADTVATVPGYNRGRMYSFALPKEYEARLEIVKDSYNGALNSSGYYTSAVAEGDITPAEDVIDFFYRVDTAYFTRAASGKTWHQQAREQLARVMNCQYRYRRARVGTTASWNTPGTLWLGPCYSNAHYQLGTVGVNVSLYTFLTATQNKRSLFYTERPEAGLSGYGIQWPTSSTDGLSSNNRAYYGVVCHDIPTIAMNKNKVYVEECWSAPGMGMSRVTVSSAEDCRSLQPLDMAVKGNSHVYMIVDVWKDADGVTRFLEVAESGAYNSHARLSLQTPEHFWQRFSDYGMTGVYRATGSDPLVDFDTDKAVEDTPFIALSPAADYTPIAYNEHICTFAGDRATFRVGEKVFVNVRRDNGAWNAMRLMKRADDPALVWRDHFEGYTETTVAKTMLLPKGWRRVHDYVTITPEYAPMLYYNASQAGSEPYSLILNKSCMTAMPRIAADISKLEMTVHISSSNTSTGDRTLSIGVLTDPDDYTTFSQVAEVKTSTLPADGLVTVDFASYSGGGHYIAFRNVKASTSDFSIFYLDDLELRLRSGESDPAAGHCYECVGLLPIDTTVYPSSSDDDPDTAAREDWVDVELTSRFAASTDAGLYRATAYNTATAAESEPTEWEMLWLSLTDVVRDGTSGGTATVAVVGATQAHLQREGASGTPTASRDTLFLSAAQMAGATVTYNYSLYNTRLALYARGVYGNDVKVSMAPT